MSTTLSVVTLDSTGTQVGAELGPAIPWLLLMVLSALLIAAASAFFLQVRQRRYRQHTSRPQNSTRRNEEPVLSEQLHDGDASARRAGQGKSLAGMRTQQQQHLGHAAIVVPQVELAGRSVGRMHVIFAATLAKDLRSPNTNEDAWALSQSDLGIAVFDGASESFAARRWSHLLAAQWATGSQTWLKSAQLEYAEFVAAMDLTWAQEAAASRGSFATFLCVRDVPGALEVTGVGDSCAIWIQETQIIEAYPLNDSRQFTSSPEALHSDMASLEAGEQKLRSKRIWWPTDDDPIEVWLATDALAAWLLVEGESNRAVRAAAIRELKSEEDFQLLVEQERESGAMKVDDCTLVRVRVKEGA